MHNASSATQREFQGQVHATLSLVSLRVIILKARTPTPQAAFLLFPVSRVHPPFRRFVEGVGTGSPHRGTSPPLNYPQSDVGAAIQGSDL